MNIFGVNNKVNNNYIKNMTFTEAKHEFDKKYGGVKEYDCFLSEHLTYGKKTKLIKLSGEKNEQYYKWQFLYSIINSGLYSKDYIGTEIRFPKGNKSSSDLILDAAIFDDDNWYEKYCEYHKKKDLASLEWLREHLLVALEFKKEDGNDIDNVWEKQLKAYLKREQS